MSDLIPTCGDCGGKAGDDPDVPSRIPHRSPCTDGIVTKGLMARPRDTDDLLKTTPPWPNEPPCSGCGLADWQKPTPGAIAAMQLNGSYRPCPVCTPEPEVCEKCEGTGTTIVGVFSEFPVQPCPRGCPKPDPEPDPEPTPEEQRAAHTATLLASCDKGLHSWAKAHTIRHYPKIRHLQCVVCDVVVGLDLDDFGKVIRPEET